MARTVALAVERLEDRCTPVVFGNPWPDASHLSLSFAPDGTAVGGRQSQLFQELNPEIPTTEWQLLTLRAFQTWAVQGNLNIHLVPDGGQPFGSRGPVQGDPRFGDVRMAAYPFASNMGTLEDVAIGSPFDIAAGTWSGDVKLNSGYRFTNGGADGYDLFTVLLHEFGHALGLKHDDSAGSVMNETYNGPRTGLSAADVAALQALYGARAPDQHEGSAGNGSFATAKALLLPNSLNGGVVIEADGDLGSTQDADYYRFNTLFGVGRMQIELQTNDVSLLTARVNVYNSAQQLVASSVALDPRNGNLIIQLNNVLPLSTYYVRVDSGTQDLFGVGGYRLRINLLPPAGLLGGPLNWTVDTANGTLLNNDLHTNDVPAVAAVLQPLLGAQQADARFDYAFRERIRDSWDVDYYRVQAPAVAEGGQLTLQAMIWGVGDSTLIPRVTVLDAALNAVPAEVLVNDGGSYTIQVRDAVPGATYFIKAAAANPSGANNVGNYFLGLDFAPRPVELAEFVEGTLDEGSKQSASTLTLTKSQIFHFVLSAAVANPAVESAVRMTVYDAAGNMLLSMVAGAGETVTRDLFLPRGTYLVRFAAGTRTGAPLPALAYDLVGGSLSDPVGPEADDPTADPEGTTDTSGEPPPDEGWWTEDDYGATGNDYWWTGSDNGGLSAQDPYSDPYSDPENEPESDPESDPDSDPP
jgi:hypothetical protein